MKCEVDGCTEEAEQYGAVAPLYALCSQHAEERGFCPGCGYLVAGNEWDDRSMGQHGICYECFKELEEEFYDGSDFHPEEY